MACLELTLLFLYFLRPFEEGDHFSPHIGETGEKWATIWESTLKIRIKMVISVSHKTIALPINILNSAMFLVIFSMAS